MNSALDVNNRILPGGSLAGSGWVEGCRIAATLRLGGENVVVGVDVDRPLDLPPGACLDVIAGQSPAGRAGWFVRCYAVGDTFKDTVDRGGTLAGQPLLEWLASAGVSAEDVWDTSMPAARRSLWDAKVFPLVPTATGYRDWLWMFDPASATAEQKQAFRAAERYSMAEIALLADMTAFYERRVWKEAVMERK